MLFSPLILILETLPLLFFIICSELLLFRIIIIEIIFSIRLKTYRRNMLCTISRVIYSDKLKYLFTVIFIIFYIIYAYFCLKLMPFHSISYDFNLHSNLSRLYHYSDDKWRLGTATLLFIIIPSMLYIYKISFALIIINYKLILYLLLGIYSILTIRSYIIYK